MANIMERISADNITTFTARIRIKGYRQQTATFSRITDARLWIQKTEYLIREGKYFSQAEAKRHTFAEMTGRYIKTVLPNESHSYKIFISLFRNLLSLEPNLVRNTESFKNLDEKMNVTLDLCNTLKKSGKTDESIAEINNILWFFRLTKVYGCQ